VVLSNLKIFLPENWRDNAAWSVFGFYFDTLLFLVCVAIFWCLVGRELDRRRSPEIIVQASMTTVGFLYNLFLLCWGIVLTVFSAINFGHLQDLARWNNLVGNLAEGFLFWAWSLTLIILPGLNLVNAIRNKVHVPGTSA
jgi:hypothetical protein